MDGGDTGVGRDSIVGWVNLLLIIFADELQNGEHQASWHRQNHEQH
jgi:hypothetical protein